MFGYTFFWLAVTVLHVPLNLQETKITLGNSPIPLDFADFITLLKRERKLSGWLSHVEMV